jgi:hypothetical protein
MFRKQEWYFFAHFWQSLVLYATDGALMVILPDNWARRSARKSQKLAFRNLSTAALGRSKTALQRKTDGSTLNTTNHEIFSTYTLRHALHCWYPGPKHRFCTGWGKVDIQRIEFCP